MIIKYTVYSLISFFEKYNKNNQGAEKPNWSIVQHQVTNQNLE
jgi:hypothetical protein